MNLTSKRLIGFTGGKGSGKDTAFEQIAMICSEAGLVAARSAFADKLKFSAARIFFPEISMPDAIKFMDDLKADAEAARMAEENGLAYDGRYISVGRIGQCEVMIDGRTFPQRYGTESHRDIFGDNFWVDQVVPEGVVSLVNPTPMWTRRFPENATACCITDVRFDNEALRIRKLGGTIIEIDRKRTEDGHVSEAGVSRNLVDYVIDNNGTLDQFHNNIRTLFKKEYFYA